MENKGIDYGMGKTNIDQKTGIRFGVINQNEVLQAWADSSEAYYGPATCPKCGNEAKEITADDDGNLQISDEMEEWEKEKYESEDYYCEDCKYIFGGESAFGEEPVAFYLDDGEYSAESDSYGDIFIMNSPYFTYSQFCSPCAPGAGYIMNEIEEKDPNNRAYCFGHDFFDDGRAPYKVYDVKTGEEVLPE